MNIGDLVRSKHEPSSVGLVIDVPDWSQDVDMEDDEYDDYCVAYIIWVKDEIEPLYKSVEEFANLEVIDVQNR
tara:strand:+ start:916 stop:1134 length:219 start_codon:yes stop_codon:yes gene_type:complete